jgi:signal transduction histidine kinase
MRKILVLFCLHLSLAGWCQQESDLPYIDIGKIDLVDTIVDRVQFSFIKKNSDVNEIFENTHFKEIKDIKLHVNPGEVPDWLLSRFNVMNSADTEKIIFFFPGFFFPKIELFQREDNHLIPLPVILPHNPDSIGYRAIVLRPHDSATIYSLTSSLKTYNNNYRPRLVNSSYLPSYLETLHHSQKGLDKWTYVFAGLLLMMILFSLSNFLQGGNREFLYYSGYAFLLAAMLSATSYNFQTTSHFSYFFEGYLDFILQSAAIACYMIFMKKFLETKMKYPFLHNLYNGGLVVIATSVVIYSALHFFSDAYWLENFVENFTKYVLLVMILVFVVYSSRHWQDILLRYLVWGNLSLFLFSFISQIFISFKYKFTGPDIFNMSLFYYEVGLFLELVCFLMGLNYKNRRQIIARTRERERLNLEVERKEFEKQMAVMAGQQEERNRISADMHDELGSGMTAIRLMSEIAKNKMKENTPVEIEKISQSADDVLNKMNAIIWSMNSKNDSLGNLISYIRTYALEYLEATQVECKVFIPAVIPDIEITGDKRRNLFLCVKETLNNILKHAKASEVMIDIALEENLVIKIWDNGIGIDTKNLRQFGNGLQNIARRMETIGGSFKIEKDAGTVTTLVLPAY